MTDSAWLGIISALLTLIGTLGAIAIKMLLQRITKLEHQDSKLNAAILTLLVAKSDDNEAIAHALHGLLTNGVKVTSGD
jgi:hypothetical protein